MEANSRANIRRTRVCKRCKFSTSDAREFLHHQINAHSESVEVHQCDKCEFVTAVYTELVSHRRVHRRSSAMSVRHASTDSEDGMIDDANNNEKQDEDDDGKVRSSSNSPQPNLPATAAAAATNKDYVCTRNYTCTECGFKCTSSKTHLQHMVDEHGADFEIFECDLCDYATRYKHKLPRHRECHFSGTPKVGTSPTEACENDGEPQSPASDNSDQLSIISNSKKSVNVREEVNALQISSHQDENGNQKSVQKSRILPSPSLDLDKSKYMALTQRLNSGMQGMSNNESDADGKGPIHMSGGQMMPSGNKVLPAFITPSNKSKGLSGAPTQVPIKAKPSCTPVREAVDPAKYVTIREPDGVKYACSKCGNIYKWRKSLNKHWKEKHEGEIPDPRPNFTPLTIPRVQGKESNYAKGKYTGSPSGVMGSYQPPVGRGVNMARPKQGKGEATRAPMLSRVLRRPPMLDTSRGIVEDGNKRYFPSLQAFENPSSDKSRSQTGLGFQMSERDILASSSQSVKNQANKYNPHDYSDVHKSHSPLGVSMSPRDMRSGAFGNGGDSEDDVLDLSKKGNDEAMDVSHAAASSFGAAPPPQDEPLDFSKKTGPATNEKSSSASSVAASDIQTKSEKFGMGSYGLYQGSMIPEHTGSISLQCPSCAYIGRNKQDYDNHMELHLRKRHYKCAECQQVFFTIGELNDHFLENHVEVLQTKAILAGMGAAGKAMYNSNSESTQLYKYLTMDSSKQLLSCVICGAIFQWQWTLAKHFEQDHPTLPNPYRKRPPSNMGGQMSNAGYEGVKRARNAEHDMQCDHCGYTSRCEAEMKRHQLKHAMTRNYNCKLCKFETKHKDDLLLHYKNSHPSDRVNLEQLISSEPSNSLTHFTPPGSNTMVDLTAQDTAIVIPQAPEDTHLNLSPKSNHGEDGTPQGKGKGKATSKTPTNGENNSAECLLPFKCSVCEYRARWPSEITQHMKNHSDEKPFLCPRCSYRSKWKWDVVKHLKRCGGGTVKDVIDTTKQRKHENVKALLAEVPSLQPEQSTNNTVQSNTRGVLSNGPPNVTVVPSMKLPTSTKMEGASSEDNEPLDDMESGLPDAASSLAYLESKIPTSASMGSSLNKSGTSQQGFIQGQQHYCLQCPFVGNSPAELKRHSRVHSDEKPFICKTCGYCSKWKCDLKKHLRTYNHTSAVPLTYGGHGRKPADWSEEEKRVKGKDGAGKGSYSRSSDEQDEDSPRESTSYRCNKCNFSTYTNELLENHMKCHSSRPGSGAFGGKLTCKKCNFEAGDLSTFLQHKLSHSQGMQDGSGSGDFAQEQADMKREYQQSPQPQKHRRKASRQFRVVPNAMENFDSSEDGSGVDEGSYLNRSYPHYQGHMDESEEEMPYNSYNKTEPEDLSKNLQRVSGASGRMHTTYNCNRCPYTTDHKTNFEKHMACHNQSNRYTCEWCDWSTDRLNLLYRHAQVVHSNELAMQEKNTFYGNVRRRSESTGSASSTSDKVKLSFAESLELRPTSMNDSASSMASVDNDDGIEQDMKSADGPPAFGYSAKKDNATKRRRRLKTCEKCGYITDNMTTLQRHIAKHGGRGKFTCHKCDYSVDRQHILQYHIKIVHDAQYNGMEYMASPSGSPSPVEGLSPATEKETGEDADEEEVADPYAGDTEEEKGEEEEPEYASVADDLQKIQKEDDKEEDGNDEEEEGEREGEEGEDEEGKEEIVTEIGKVKGQDMKLTRQGKKITYGCLKCPFETPNVTNASNHLKQHGLGKKYKCEHCDYSQDQLRHVIHHMKTLHGTSGGDKDDEEKEGEGEEQMEIPEEGESPEKDEEEEEEHEDSLNDSNHENENPNLKAEGDSSDAKCEKVVSKGNGAKKLGGAQVNKYHCHKCPFTTLSRGKFLTHQTCHSNGNGKNRCSMCGHKATTSRLLRRHMQQCHP